MARVHSCITAPKKKSAEEIRTLMETFVKSSPFVIAVVQWDESSPVLVPCYSTSAALSVMKLLSFVLFKNKNSDGTKTSPGALCHDSHAGVIRKSWMKRGRMWPSGLLRTVNQRSLLCLCRDSGVLHRCGHQHVDSSVSTCPAQRIAS